MIQFPIFNNQNLTKRTKSISLISRICPTESSAFYQACGLQNDVRFFDEDPGYPCGYLCSTGHFNYFLDTSNPAITILIQTTNICKGATDSKEGFDLAVSGKCDGYCYDVKGIPLCVEEKHCNGYNYGLMCKDRSYIGIDRICDGKEDCPDGIDEKLCLLNSADNIRMANHEDIQTCNRYNYSTGLASNTTVPLFNFNRCGPVAIIRSIPFITTVYTPYCDGYRDQTNCTDPDRIGLFCEIDGFMSSVSKQIICNKYIDFHVNPLCDDALDSDCVIPSLSCEIHKHQMCDGIQNCNDGIDESAVHCSEMTHRGCKRRFQTGKVIPFPFTWIKDGVLDCVDGIDETFVWPTCGFRKTQRFVSNQQSSSCTEVYLCQDGFVELHELCDRLDSCGNENKICEQARRQTKTFNSPVTGKSNIDYSLFHCLPGLDNFPGSKCTSKRFRYPKHDILGGNDNRSVLAPITPVDCKNTFGKIFVLLSCLDKCKDSPCPLKRLLKHNWCVGQYQDRIFTIANNSYLTFILLSRENDNSKKYHFEIFPCLNRRCVTYDKVCDLVDDCGDQSDEIDCNNHFQCNTSKALLSLSKVCDGTIDCMDMSDECNAGCGKRIVSSQSVRNLGWTVGFLAICLNSISLPKHIYDLKRCKVARSMFNVIFLILINIGDLLVALYVQIIVVFDVAYKESYCTMQLTWLTSAVCSLVGVLSTFGTCISVLSMTILSINRLFVMKSGMVASPQITKKHVTKVTFITSIVIFISFSISILPLFSFFEDFFVNGVVYSSKNPLLLGKMKKTTLFKMMSVYYGRIRAESLSWHLMESLVSDIFSKDYTVVLPRKLNFYGNDAVCLFKYFVTPQDPQLNFVWMVLTFHGISILIIIFSYIGIWNETKKSSAHLTTSTQNDHVKQRNSAMQRKIMIIIGTDSLIWIPFLLLSVLHFAELVNGTSWYPVFSIVILPLNTVINPLILNDAVKLAALSLLKHIMFGITKVHASISNIMNSSAFGKNIIEFFAGYIDKSNDIELPAVIISNVAEDNEGIIETDTAIL